MTTEDHEHANGKETEHTTPHDTAQEPHNHPEDDNQQTQTQPQDDQTTKDYTSLLNEALEYKKEGNKLYSNANYDDAITHYTKAIDIMQGGHAQHAEECSVFFGNRAACYVALKNHEGVIKDCTASLNLAPSYVKALQRRAVAYEATKQFQKALTDFEALYKIDPTLKMAIDAKVRLPPLVKEQQEKETQEMIGKLKDLGNSILGKFGLSTDNFQFNKDPATGSYSINMKK